MRNLNTVLPKNEQTLGTEDVDNRIDVCRHPGSRGVQIGPAASAPDEPAIRHDDGELGKYQTRRVTLSAGQGVEGGLSTPVDRVGHSARTSVTAQSQHVTLTAFPGSGHCLGHQRQRAAA